MLRRGLLVVAACLSIAACGGSVPNSNPEANGVPLARLFAAKVSPTDERPSAVNRALSKPVPPKPLAQVRMNKGGVVVTPPQGYCIDPTTVQRSAGFAVIASCSILSEGDVGRPVDPVIVTVTVGPKASPGEVPSPQALAEAVGVQMLGGRAQDGFTAVHLASGGSEGLPGGDDRHWRGAFVQSGRLIGLALYAPKGSGMAGDTGGAMLARVRAAMAAPNDGIAQSSKKPGQATGFFGRLFNRQDLR